MWNVQACASQNNGHTFLQQPANLMFRSHRYGQHALFGILRTRREGLLMGAYGVD